MLLLCKCFDGIRHLHDGFNIAGLLGNIRGETLRLLNNKVLVANILKGCVRTKFNSGNLQETQKQIQLNNLEF